MLIVISNTSPLIYFGIIGKLSILKRLYSQIYIPTEVWNELIHPILKTDNGIPKGVNLGLVAKKAGWLIIKNPEDNEYIEIAN